jgi:hypothetical protein
MCGTRSARCSRCRSLCVLQLQHLLLAHRA